MVPKRFMEAFIIEAHDLLSEIDQAALALEAGGPSQASVNQLFRAFHTIKGSAGACGLGAIVDFTNHVENLLDLVREGEKPVSPKLVDLMLRSEDQIASLLAAEQGAAGPHPRLTQKLIADLCDYAGLPIPDGSKAKENVPETEGAFLF